MKRGLIIVVIFVLIAIGILAWFKFGVNNLGPATPYVPDNQYRPVIN